MFRLEKVFQNDDKSFVLFTNILKSFAIFSSIYIYSILENRTIYQLLDFDIFAHSQYYQYGFYFPIIFFIIITSTNKIIYQLNFISFLKKDILSFILSNFLILSLFFIFGINLSIDKNFLYLIIFLLSILSITKLYFNYIYNFLIDKNIIQKNIMLVGTYEEIKKILNENFYKINVFKCCLMVDFKENDIRYIKSELKIPIFNDHDDIRSILEYHALGQIWILNGEEDKKKKVFNKIIQFSVDTLNVDLSGKLNLKGKKLLGNKFDYHFYERSRFYGINLFFKVLIDKFFSIIFLVLASPVLIISAILIFIEDGTPILFTQNRTGWDGRRFKIYKLRSLVKGKYDTRIQVIQNDNRILKIGKFIRKFSVDELPQFYNVLIGDMSIVGPRPHPVDLDIKYALLFKSFLKRHKTVPGITGWAQVNGLRGATPDPELMKKRMEFDLWYLNNWTIYLDLYIIFKTFYALIKYKGD
ncbi:exopolysaccharide biosynthesis polyprenyl glycosylphosphotransferase [Pelagibacteraceae bacterium]|nr:exopolysaccharide biosynthesis polyprenyl glycosylphosphotransferase [Pelagibacteraceae bacterium]